MPYIKQEDRPKMDQAVKMMLSYGVKDDGKLNYVLAKFFLRLMESYGGMSYNKIKNFLGELQETAAEIRRRHLAPYEDVKRFENGDVE